MAYSLFYVMKFISSVGLFMNASEVQFRNNSRFITILTSVYQKKYDIIVIKIRKIVQTKEENAKLLIIYIVIDRLYISYTRGEVILGIIEIVFLKIKIHC